MKYRIQLYYVRFGNFDIRFHIERKKHCWSRWKSIEEFDDRIDAEKRLAELREIENDRRYNHTDFSEDEWLYLRNRIAKQKWYCDE